MKIRISISQGNKYDTYYHGVPSAGLHHGRQPSELLHPGGLLRRASRGRAGEGRGCTDFMHSCSRVRIEYRSSHPHNAGTERVGLGFPTTAGGGMGGKGGRHRQGLRKMHIITHTRT